MIKRTLKKNLSFFPKIKYLLRTLISWFIKRPYLHYPQVFGGELGEIKKVLYTGNWNSSYSNIGAHTKLEKAFSNYVGMEHAIAVNTGGMALQMIFRAIGLKPGDEVVHQVDTCVATSFSVINSFATPVFSDINPDTFMLNRDDVIGNITPRTKVLLPVHMWGNPENMNMVTDIASNRNLIIIEDACLSLGAEWNKRKVGTYGLASAFSFGCLKPIQAGEGGMIVTNDPGLAKEIRILRDWGETTQELGYRDNKTLSWNGRMSEFVAAVAYQQLKGYQQHLEEVRENVHLFATYIKNVSGISLVNENSSYNKSANTQVVLKIDDSLFKKEKLLAAFERKGISVWHANFEPINSLGFFKSKEWQSWIFKTEKSFLEKNYEYSYPNSNFVYKNTGIGINKIYFLKRRNVVFLTKIFDQILSQARA